MADLTDDDYRAIALAAHTYRVDMYRDGGPTAWGVFDGATLVDVRFGSRAADAHCDILNGRAAVAEYKRRRK